MVNLPESIQQDMRQWRNEMAPFPPAYNDYHRLLAKLSLELRTDIHVLEYVGMFSYAYGSPAKFLRIHAAVKEDNSWNIKTLQWHESGVWFECAEH